MSVRQNIVDDWSSKLKGVSIGTTPDEGRFAWLRQVYARIYRFLTARYSEGNWRAGNVGESSTLSKSVMPFVDNTDVVDGLEPKRPDRIRKTLDAIHNSSPCLATPGKSTASRDDLWLAVAAFKKSSHARALRRRLEACRIEAGFMSRSGDTAIVVRHEDFQDAMAVVQQARHDRQGNHKLASFRVVNDSSLLSPVSAVGGLLLMATLGTLIAELTFTPDWRVAQWATVIGLWSAAIASAWLCFGRRCKR